MNKNIKKLNLKEAVIKRPGIYLGSSGDKGIINLFKGVFTDCIEDCKTGEIFFKIKMEKKDKFSISIKSKKDLSTFLNNYNLGIHDSKINHLKLLKIVSKNFELLILDAKSIIIKFEFDPKVIEKLDLDYHFLSEEILQLAILNRNSEFLITDKRSKYSNQNYFHFEQGIFYLLDRICAQVLGKPEFEIKFDNEFQEYQFQIAIAYRTDWFPSPSIMSFANDIHTTCGGSLVDGIIDGLIQGTRKFVRVNKLKTYKLRKKKFYNGLIVICHVKGKNFTFGGSFKEKLEVEKVKQQSKKLVGKLAFEYLTENNELAKKLLWRFDETQLMSKVY